jgi:predicted O-methyltransferase YrrM
MFYKLKIKKLVNNIRSTANAQNENFALTSLLKLFKNEAFFPLTNWSMSPTEILHICNDILINKRVNIIEFGGGFSTLCIAKLIKTYNLDIKFTSVENDLEWVEKIKSQLKMHELEEIVNLVHAPIIPISNEFSYNGQKAWYDIESINQIVSQYNEIDLVIIDGPFGQLTPFARFSAIPVLLKKIAANYAVFLDDTNRPDEMEIAENWMKILNGDRRSFYRYTYFSSNNTFNSIPMLTTL